MLKWINSNASSIAGLVVSLALARAGFCQIGNFDRIDVPGSIATVAAGVNDSGDVVGRYTTPDNRMHGFLLRGEQFTTIDFPNAASTTAIDIARNGDVVGLYIESSGKQHGYILSSGRYTTIDFPNSEMSYPTGINSKGDLVGMYWNPSGDNKHRGYLMSGGKFTSFEYPAPNLMSCFFGINDAGDMVGHWQDTNGIRHGWLVRKGQMSSFDLPGSRQTGMNIQGITAAGEIAGSFQDSRGKTKAYFMDKSGAHTVFDVPDSKESLAYRLNSLGQIVGYYTDSGGGVHGFQTRLTSWRPAKSLVVDDDGLQCPGAIRTIQEAVAQAGPGTTILVCPGIYTHTVNIVGAGKTGLRLIANGTQDEVILQGDYTERDGFHLEDVTNVLIRGFTIRDFGNGATTATEWGNGANIYLQNAHYNGIENNRLINGDMVGIWLVDSGNNTIQQNSVWFDNVNLANCGMHLGGAKSANNVIRQNSVTKANMAGIMLSDGGTGNLVVENVFNGNGRFGIHNRNTSGTRIEGNRTSYNRGPWGTTPYPKEVVGVGIGINVQESTGLVVFDNRVRGNTGTDINWDGKGENTFDSNACDTAAPALICVR